MKIAKNDYEKILKEVNGIMTKILTFLNDGCDMQTSQILKTLKDHTPKK